jgi:octaprenyl-diphosphate synthase
MNSFALSRASRLVAGELGLFESRYGSQLEYSGEYLRSILSLVAARRGKWIRPAVYFLVQKLLSPSSVEDIDLAVVVELLHTGSLLHDDVVDNADRRRGAKSLNALAGNRLAILSGDYLLARALSLAVSLPYPDALPVLSRTLLDITEAEFRQTEMERTDAVSKALYLDIMRGKTASLFAAVCELAARIRKADPRQVESLRGFGLAFGIAFQVRDDIADLSGDAETMGKPSGQDLRNGKWTLPLILAVERAGVSGRAEFLMRMGRFSPEDRRWLRDSILIQEGAEMSEAVAGAKTDEAVELLSYFPDSEYKTALMELCGIRAQVEKCTTQGKRVGIGANIKK